MRLKAGTAGRKILACVLAAAMVIAVPGSGEAKKKAVLSKKKITLAVGKSKKIGIKNRNKKARYKFSIVSGKKKIKVSRTGKITALKAGKAKVKVKETIGKKSRVLGKVSVTVKGKKNNTKRPDESTGTPKETQPAPVNTSALPTGGAPSSTDPAATEVPADTPTETPGVSQNYVYKNYFEDGDVNGFTARGGAIEVSNSENHTEGGMNSLFVTNRSATWHGAQISLGKLAVTGEDYSFSAWVKQDTGEEQKIAMKLQYTDKAGQTQYKSVISGSDDGPVCPSGSWIQLEGQYVIPEADGDVMLYFEMGTSESEGFLLDDVEIAGKAAEFNSFEVSDEIYARMKENSLYSSGNNAKIKQAIAKAQSGEDVTLAYIGGSITEGALAQPNGKCYAEVSANAFAEKYGKDGGSNVHFINAGMSGTPSNLGVVRYNRDVIGRLPEGSSHPDVLFIEFAVNDYGEVTKGGAYEGLIRQALKSGSAVVLIFSVFKAESGGRVCEMDLRTYGDYYDLPMISMGDAIMGYFKDDGFYDWYFGDSLHPNNTGHRLMSDCIMNLFDTINTEAAEEDNIPDVDAKQPKKTAAYQGIKMLDSSVKAGDDAAVLSIDAGGFSSEDSATGNFQYSYNGQNRAPWFPDNWMHDASSGSASWKATLNCKTLLLVYKQSSETNYGSADVIIDGEKITTLNCYNKSGWNNGAAYVALTDQSAGEHTIELAMAEGSEEKKFTLLAVGYN